MPDTRRSLADILTLFADNTAGDISAQDARDMIVSVMFPQRLCDGRLTLESGVAVSTTDQTAKANIYFTPLNGNVVGLYDGTSWKPYTFSEITLALGTLTDAKNYDVFLYDNSGTLTLEALAWTNDTTRATALVLQDGVWCKTGALTRRYLGTFRTTSTTTTEDSLTKRFLWNLYNRVRRQMLRVEGTTSWTYTTNTLRQANNSTSNQVAYVAGLSFDAISAAVIIHVSNNNGGMACTVGIGIDSSTVRSDQLRGHRAYVVGGVIMSWCKYFGYPGIGYHEIRWLEASEALGTSTWWGVIGTSPSVNASGLDVIMWN